MNAHTAASTAPVSPRLCLQTQPPGVSSETTHSHMALSLEDLKQGEGEAWSFGGIL